MQTYIKCMICVFFCVVAYINVQAETRHIHLLKLLDNENPDYILREGCRSIDYGIQQEVRLIANNLGIDNIIEYNLSGPNFNMERLDKVLNYEMSYLERDIVILVYVGHGYREEGSLSPYPKLYFNAYDQSVDFIDIQERIMDKNPSLLMNIVIACNVTLEDQSIPPPFESINAPPSLVTLPKSGRILSAYQQLFADQKEVGKIINLFSAQEEYYTFISKDGGIFFNEVLYAFQEALGGKPFNGWQDLCATIEKRSISRSELKGIQQKPLCEYSIRMAPVEVLPPQRFSLLQSDPCVVAVRSVRKEQRQNLRSLRRIHRENLQAAKKEQKSKAERKLLAQEQRVEYENLKLRHEKEYQRRLQQCN